MPLNSCPRCGHRFLIQHPSISTFVCPECLRGTWQRAQRAQLQAQRLGAARLGSSLLTRPPSDPSLPAPLLDYQLPPLLEVLGELAATRQNLPVRETRTTLYVWGYGSPEALNLMTEYQETEAARRFAAERGWEPGRPGAWARQRSCRMSLSQALREQEPAISRDPSVVGWGGEMRRCQYSE